MKSRKQLSTFDKEMKNPKFKKAFDKGYKKFLMSELIISLMENDEKSVRDLAKEIGLSATIIQKLRTQSHANIRINNFINLFKAFGYRLVLEKNSKRILVSIDAKHLINFAYLI